MQYLAFLQPTVGPPGPPGLVAQAFDNGVSVSVPSHAPGDLILVIGRQISSAPSAPPATLPGFTTLQTASPDFGFATSVQWAVDVGNAINALANPSGYTWSVFVFRGASGIGASAVRDLDDVGSAATFPTLGLVSSASTVLGVAVLNQQRSLSVPSGMTALQQHDGAFGGGSFDVFQEVAPAAFTGRTSSWGGGSAYWVTYSIEILGA